MSEIRVEQSPKRVRAMFNGQWVADSHPLLVWEFPYYPTYYFPNEDVADESCSLLTPKEFTTRSSATDRPSTSRSEIVRQGTPRCAIQIRRPPRSEGQLGWIGQPWITGSKKTKRSTCTLEVRITESTH